MDKFSHKPPESSVIHKESTPAEHERRYDKPHSVYLVMEVSPGSSAEDAGLQVGDEILSVDGKLATNFESWVKHARQKADQPMVLKVWRDGAEIEIRLVQEYVPKEDRYRAGFFCQSELRSGERVETIDLGGDVVLRHHGKMFDADGKEICSYQFDLDKESILRSGLQKERKTDLVRRLRSFVLRAPGDETKEIDLLERFNPKNALAYVAQGSSDKAAGIHKPSTNEVILQRPVGNFYDAHVLLHELRHAEQMQDPRFAELRHFYGEEKQIIYRDNKTYASSPWDPGFIVAKLEDISNLAGLHNLKGKFNDEFVQKLWNIVQESEDSGDFEKEKSSLMATEIVPGITIQDVLMLPRRMMERDAEFGALSAERKIREETGIDLFGLYRNYREENRWQNEAFMALESIINSAVDSSDEKWVQIKDDIKEELKKLEKEGIKSTVVQSVRNYMSSIGATPGIIRKYLEASEKKEV